MPFLLEFTRGDGSRIYHDSEKVYAIERATAEIGTQILALIEVTPSDGNGQLLGLSSHEILAVEGVPGNSRLVLAVIHVAESYRDVMQRIDLVSALTLTEKH